MRKPAKSIRDLVVVLGFVCLAFVPFMGKPFHIDEPLFLAPARHILIDPLHPLDFKFNWHGEMVSMAQINNTPPLPLYLLALALKITGSSERLMRLMFLPFDLAMAAALYLLAARFLSRPLLPVLIVIAGPAYLIGMNLLYPDKFSAAFGFVALYALIRSIEESDAAWYWGSAVLLDAAIVCKYSAVIFLVPAVVYSLRKGIPLKRICGFLALALSGIGIYILTSPFAVSTALNTTAWGTQAFWSTWPHKLRSFLAFTGGCAVVTTVWPYLLFRKKFMIPLALTFAASVLLFAPPHDIPFMIPRGIDRFMGILFSCGALFAFVQLFGMEARRRRGWTLWASWALAAAGLELFVYWSIIARIIFLLIPPLIFSMAEVLESIWPPGRLKRLYTTSFALTLILSLSLAKVDYDYAAAQKIMAQYMTDNYLAKRKKVWFTGHWGLQYYLEKTGGVVLAESNGWESVKPGDFVLIPLVNDKITPPKHPLTGIQSFSFPSPIPLRLMSDFGYGHLNANQAGFYSSVWGFLPYAVSRKPVDEFQIAIVDGPLGGPDPQSRLHARQGFLK